MLFHYTTEAPVELNESQLLWRMDPSYELSDDYFGLLEEDRSQNIGTSRIDW